MSEASSIVLKNVKRDTPKGLENALNYTLEWM